MNPALSSEQVLEALLDVDEELGCCPDTLRAVRKARNVRRAVVHECGITPCVRWHDIVVNYDEAAHRELNPAQHDFIHQALQPAHLAIRRTGRHAVRIAEIVVGYSMSVACQAKLVLRLGLWPTCIAEARTALDTILGDAPNPIMSHCGPAMTVYPHRGLAVPSLHQINGQRLLNLVHFPDRFGQDYALLAVAPD